MSFNSIQEIKDKIELKTKQHYIDARANVVLAEKGQEGLSGFVFDIASTESINLSADVTDHYTENDSFLQDHRTVKPITVNISGFIGELVFKPKGGLLGALSSASSLLETVDAFAGDYTPQAIQDAQRIANEISSAVNVLESAVTGVASVVNAVTSLLEPEPTRQQIAYKQLESLFNVGGLVTLQTPWNFFDDLMITSIGFSQDEKSDGISDISIGLKQIRVSEVKFATFDLEQALQREAVQKAYEEKLGTLTSGKCQSAFYAIYTGIGDWSSILDNLGKFKCDE